MSATVPSDSLSAFLDHRPVILSSWSVAPLTSTIYKRPRHSLYRSTARLLYHCQALTNASGDCLIFCQAKETQIAFSTPLKASIKWSGSDSALWWTHWNPKQGSTERQQNHFRIYLDQCYDSLTIKAFASNTLRQWMINHAMPSWRHIRMLTQNMASAATVQVAQVVSRDALSPMDRIWSQKRIFTRRIEF